MSYYWSSGVVKLYVSLGSDRQRLNTSLKSYLLTISINAHQIIRLFQIRSFSLSAHLLVLQIHEKQSSCQENNEW